MLSSVKQWKLLQAHPDFYESGVHKQTGMSMGDFVQFPYFNVVWLVVGAMPGTYYGNNAVLKYTRLRSMETVDD